MRRIKSVLFLGMLASLVLFKTYFDQVPRTSDIEGEVEKALKALQISDEKSAKHPSPIIILTYMRSGSSFVGDVLQQNNDVFYLFEPLRIPQFAVRKNKTFTDLNGNNRFYDSFLDVGRDIVRNWTTCNLFDLPDVVWTDSFISKSKHAKVFRACLFYQSKQKSQKESRKYCVNMLRDICLKSKFIVMKIIRLPLDRLETLMAEFPKMKIIHLVRDPRATILSQMRFGVIKRKSFQTNVIDFCSRIYRDLVTIDIFSQKFSGRILTFLYEEIAKRPLELSKSLYTFTNVQYTPNIQKFVYNITMAGKSKKCGILCTVKSNSSAQADAWRSKLDMTRAVIIDHACRPVYKRLGYKEIKSEEMLQNSGIPLQEEPEPVNDYRYV